jgi:flagellar basal body-associated protein FliL
MVITSLNKITINLTDQSHQVDMQISITTEQDDPNK